METAREKKPPPEIWKLFEREHAGFDSPGRGAAGGESPDTNEDPEGAARRLASRTVPNRLGLALSGGGIRSATFNLGLLQTLWRLGLLRHVDYLSTVSGGGYVGGWYSKWRAKGAANGDFPAKDNSSPELIHLRRFASFLWPRWELLSTDTGMFVAYLLGSLIPALAGALGLLLLGHLVFHVLREVVTQASSAWSGLAIAGITLLFLAWRESVWFDEQTRAKQHDAPRLNRGYGHAKRGIVPFALLVGVAHGWLLERAGLPARSSLAPLTALLAVAGVWLLVRFLLSGWNRITGVALFSGANDRHAARLLFLAGAWTMAVVLWWIGEVLLERFSGWVFASGGLLSAGSSYGAFAIVRKLTNIGDRPERSGWKQALARLTPQLASYLALGLVLVLTAAAWIVALETCEPVWIGLSPTALALGGGSALTCLLVLVFFDPRTCGLHEAYRAKIARAFLGAGINDQTEEASSDDGSLLDLPERPLHLVCCAANDLGSNDLKTLNRGAKSAVLSRHGIQVGEWWSPWSHAGNGSSWHAPSIGSAITASAAAFNPNMGAQSKKLGKAVTFLLAALNMRLGLWLPERRFLPGLRFYQELLGHTFADPEHGKPVHLSDGAHFENLGLYELVRRRCRLIIAADCGADPDYEFGDVGNCIRRLRQDFNVDVRIDLGLLRPGPDGRVLEHAAVGDVFYDDGDSGILVLLKPGLSGDEPGDIGQYKSSNPVFPQETTGDQFYDHEQWESYRRLGQHVGEQAFRCLALRAGKLQLVKEVAPDESRRIEILQRVFTAVRQDLYPTPPDYGQRFQTLTERCNEVDERVRASAPHFLLTEFFPEAGSPPTEPPGNEEWLAAVQILILVTQLMEDVWQGLELDRFPGHPMNLGWINYFQRWTSTPTFRMWWPILRPIWGPGLQHYLEREFGVEGAANPRWQFREPGARDHKLFAESPSAHEWLEERGRKAGKDRLLLIATVAITHPSWPTKEFEPLVGALNVERAGDGPWAMEERGLWVAPGLANSGIEAALLQELGERADKQHVAVVVTVRLGPVANLRSDTVRLVAADRLRLYEVLGYRARRRRASDPEFCLERSPASRPANP